MLPLRGPWFPFNQGSTPTALAFPKPRALSCTAVATGDVTRSACEVSALGENVWSCAATAHFISGVLGKQVVVPKGRRKPQVWWLVCGWLLAFPTRPLWWHGQGITSLPSKAPRFLRDHPPYLVLCILSWWLFLLPPNVL